MANNYTLEKPQLRARIVALVVAGESDLGISRILALKGISVTRQAITAFRHRHADLIQPAAAEVDRQIIDYAIAAKVNRIAGYNADYQGLAKVIEARSTDVRYQDEPGYSTGLMVHSLKMIGGGKDATIVSEFKVDTAVIAERRALAMAAAEELGQLEKGGVNIDNRTQILVRQYGGFDLTAID